MRSNCFEPTVIHAQVGQLVRWTNRDPVDHMVTGARRAFGDYTSVRSGGVIDLRFAEPGVFPYFCALHPSMAGASIARPRAGGGVPRTTALALLAGGALFGLAGAWGGGLVRRRLAALTPAER
ncbi:MAG: hypothetical protein FJZ92_08560 [Chloroflexi bacterium]|nr:hypothetical protein [Chloroflexota bacterium]